MKRQIFVFSICLLLFFAAAVVAETGEGEQSHSIWLGGHYTDFKDYTAKVGEYRLQSDKFFPEFKLDYFSRSGASVFRLDGHYFDYDNANGRLRTTTGDIFKAEFQYRSLTKNSGMDLLENFETRELTATGPGGKIITHEFLDNVTEFKTHRQEITSKAEVLLSRKHDVRLIAAHRMIREDGNVQEVGNNHCFSCHLGSQSVEVDKRTNSFKVGLEAKALEQKLAYAFGYRQFENRGPETYFFYDQAKHPGTGGSIAEFESRMNYDNASLPINSLPKTEKMSHKISSKGKLGTSNYAAALTYSRVENKKTNFTNTDLVSEVFGGQINVSAPLSPKMRMIVKLGVQSIDNTDPFIDLDPWREGRPQPGGAAPPSFDYTRYSALDRTNIDGSAEVITRLNPKMTLAVLAGYESISRSDYPLIDGDNTTSTLIGQVKLNYRKGLTYSNRLKYRFEKTSDPFTSGRGLFEMNGRDYFSRPIGFPFVFYYQREDLRYQNITTLPTDKHEIEFSSTYRPTNQVNLTVGFRGTYDKNGDLDSLDVKHTSIQPNLNVTLTPDPRWTMAAGYTYNQSKSRGPVSIALFDG